MGWVAVAVAGATLVSGWMASQSAASSAASARRAADANARLQYDMEQQKLDFAKEQQAKWEERYGPIEDNLASFYGSLSESSLAASGLQQQAKAFTEAKANIARQAAQSGMSNTALKSIEANMELQNAEEKAKIRAEAPMKVAEAKSGFLAAGRGQNPRGMVSDAMGSMSQMYGNRQNMYMNQMMGYQQQQAAGWQTMGNALETGANAYMKYQTYQNMQNQATAT